MKRNKSSISNATSYREIGEFWDTHDLADYWDKTKPAHFDVELESETTFFGVEKSLSKKLAAVAKQKGVSSRALLNRWLEEKLSKKKAA